MGPADVAEGIDEMDKEYAGMTYCNLTTCCDMDCHGSQQFSKHSKFQHKWLDGSKGLCMSPHRVRRFVPRISRTS